MPLKILFLLSAPHQDLSLDEGYRTIERAIQRNSSKDTLQLIPKLSTRIEDLVEALNQEQPDIIHFSGHGNSKGELIFTGDDVDNNAISSKVLANLFKVTSNNVKLIFLDACHSNVQAETLNSEIDYVIGMSGFISEEVATTFASNFYASFASKRTVKEAFEQAKIIVEIKHPHEKKVPQLLVRNKKVQDFNISNNEIEKPKNKKVTNIVKGNLYGVQHIEKGGSATFRFEK
ncbi:MAG: CHAT domain-containing protein [Epsilonproteobacteria bacterium]|nr:CHAT domain-containing protein [Campylobacterota bacterium]